MKQKRGISPLIATILLIGFTVILAVLVLTWSQGWFSGLTESATESTSLQLVCVNKGGLFIQEVCETATSTTKVTVVNTGSETHTTGSIIGGGTSDSYSDLTSGNTTSVELSTVLGAGDVISSVFQITTGLGISTCQGSSYAISSAGLKSCL